MKQLLIILFLLICTSSLLLPQIDNRRTDYVFMIDISGSMVGLPEGSGNKNIFPEVKAALTEYITQIPKGNNVIIIPFHEGVQGKFEKLINSNDDYKSISTYLNQLIANGRRTFIYQSIDHVFKNVSINPDRSNRILQLYLYTDGQDNGPGNFTFNSILEEFELKKEEYSGYAYFKYITLGIASPAFNTELPEGVTLLEEPPGKVHTNIPISITPHVLDFGNLAHVNSSTRTVLFNYDDRLVGNQKPVIRLSAQFDELEQSGLAVKISPLRILLNRDSYEIKIEVINLTESNIHQIENIDVTGLIKLSSEDPYLSINPNIIQSILHFYEKMTVELLPIHQTKLTFDFGELENQDGYFVGDIPVRVKFNQSAVQNRVFITFDIDQSINNPKLIDLGEELSFSNNGNLSRSFDVLAQQEIIQYSLILRLPEEAKHGEYSGAVKVNSSEKSVEIIADIEGFDTESSGSVFSIPFTFKIPLIIPIWIWIFISAILITLGFIIYCLKFAPSIHPGFTIKLEGDALPTNLIDKAKFCGAAITVGGFNQDVQFMEFDNLKFTLKPIPNDCLKMIANADMTVNGIKILKGQSNIIDSFNKTIIEVADSKIVVNNIDNTI